MTEDRLEALLRRLRHFASERDWGRFHSPKNLAMALAGEAGELVAEFQWKPAEETEASALSPAELSDIRAEMADVAIYLLLLSDRLGVDLVDAAAEKMAKNETRFPKRLP